MKKQLLLSLLAASVSAACQVHAETWPEPVGPSQSDFGGVGLMQTPTARMAKEGEFSVNFAITINIATILPRCSCSRGWKPPYAIPMCVPAVTAQ